MFEDEVNVLQTGQAFELMEVDMLFESRTFDPHLRFRCSLLELKTTNESNVDDESSSPALFLETPSFETTFLSLRQYPAFIILEEGSSGGNISLMTLSMQSCKSCSRKSQLLHISLLRDLNTYFLMEKLDRCARTS